MVHEFTGKGQTRGYIFRLKSRMLSKNILSSIACTQISKHCLYGDAQSANNGLAVANIRINSDAAIMKSRRRFHHRYVSLGVHTLDEQLNEATLQLDLITTDLRVQRPFAISFLLSLSTLVTRFIPACIF